MSSVNAKFLFVVCLVVNCILWSQSRYALSSRSTTAAVWKRDFAISSAGTAAREAQCRPLAFPSPSEQCAHVRHDCPAADTFLSIPYLELYFCSEPPVRPFVFTCLVVWLLFVFSTLGISASDFFTPNLATIAQFLGLDENVAGVTFLAFGNASPDVFSTFSAMRADSGSLALGELLGAASFIVSCVVGSMCIILPFKVNRAPFLRDVGFFTVAISMLLVILRDGQIVLWESGMLVGLYILYALTVILSSWWERRREKQLHYEAIIRAEYMEVQPYVDEEPYSDQPVPAPSSSDNTLSVPLVSPVPTRGRSTSSPNPPRLGIQTELPQRAHSRTPSPISSSSHLAQMPSFSLVGALEFRQVVASLQSQAAASSLNMFDTPVTPYAGGHYHHPHTHTSSGSRSPSAQHETDPWDAVLGVPLNERSPRLLRTSINDEEEHEEGAPAVVAPVEETLLRTPLSGIPSISRTPASPTDSDASTDVEIYIPPTRHQRLCTILARTWHILFPSLHHFWSKPLLGKTASLLAAPAVMALTLTLPVVVIPYANHRLQEEKMRNGGGEPRLVDFEEEGVERTLIAEQEIQRDLHEMKFNKWLMAAQCVLGPLFCVGVLFAGVKYIEWILAGTAICGIVIAMLVLIFADGFHHPTACMARCSMGFFVAIVWIMAIADEVVHVLQTFGFIFGLSDAIIGLTIFAVGNSLADLVANMSVFAPIMGFSACFGGPMVNILLGVGISGSYIINKTQSPYHFHFTPTLVTSTVGLLVLLLITLFVVPLNGYFLSRRWGVFLIFSYIVLMSANLFVELHFD
ncbi:Sodium/calcium exchanger protein-domain-containing protein [Phlebopus sp. FC_14]|nr:Sodium/calcium exchanger protein-domain-containing protein [Phlebopus sp. FC_14]